MWAQASALLLLLLLACCLWSSEAQSDRRQSIWEDPITFNTKSKDLCTMTVTGHRQFTKLRVSCKRGQNQYWCDFVGKPQTCRPYNKNPRHYFVQMMWGLRKLSHACQGPRRIKPHMCRNAADESQMIFSGASFYPSRSRARQENPPARRQPAPTRHDSAKQVSSKTTELPPVQTTKSTTTQPPTSTTQPPTSTTQPPTSTTQPPTSTTQPPTSTVASTAKKMAQQYCWRSLEGICSYVIGLFRRE